jgi:hypothetical protein
MMGRQGVDQGQLFYLFNLEGRIPANHLLRQMNPTDHDARHFHLPCASLITKSSA